MSLIITGYTFSNVIFTVFCLSLVSSQELYTVDDCHYTTAGLMMFFPGPFCSLRFTPEEKAKRHPCAYLPFGYGPRNCIGMRFALLEAKMALIEILSKFRIVLAPETKVRPMMHAVLALTL